MPDRGRSLICLCSALVLSCVVGSEDFETREGRLDGGGDSAGAAAGFCPEDEPKEGDPCPRQMTADNRCSYKSEECEQNGSFYTVTVTYCCFGGFWKDCGTTGNCPMSEPPDAEVPAMTMMPDMDLATPADAAPPRDVARPPADAAAPAEPDAADAAPPAELDAADAAVDVTPDTDDDDGVDAVAADAM